jgi:hypothetical protein
MKQQQELTQTLCHAQQVLEARKHMSEVQTAQILVQHLELTKMIQSLEAKEKKKKNDRTILFPGGFGRHLTDDQFVQQLQEQEQRKAAQSAERAQRMEGRDAQRAIKAAAEAEWKRMLADHEAAVEIWKANCERLRGEGTHVKDLPAKPKCPLKPKHVENEAIRLPEGEEEEDDEFESGRKE